MKSKYDLSKAKPARKRESVKVQKSFRQAELDQWRFEPELKILSRNRFYKPNSAGDLKNQGVAAGFSGAC